MNTTAHIIGWASDMPKSSREAQGKALVGAGVPQTDVVVHGRQMRGRSRKDWPWLLKKLRPGDVLAVTTLRAIYDPRAGRSPRRALFRRLHDIEDLQCTIMEISTGRSTANQRDRDTMIAATLDALARSRTGGDAGRPAREWSPAERAIIERHWFSTEHATNARAFAAIKSDAKAAGLATLAKMKHSQSIGAKNAFGPSGRAKLRRAKK
jgi:hypothetical protein